MEKVSIVIPAYNCEYTLGRALDSIINQDYSNIEVIVVDDGSKDGTYEVINSYLKKDYRIKAIKQQNMGPSSARNKGIELATGDYFMFVDADDELERNSLGTSVEMMKSYQCDLLIAATKKRVSKSSGKIDENIVLTNLMKYSNNQDIWNDILLLMSKGIINSPWGKLYKRKIIVDNKLKMDIRLDMGEDLQFNLLYMEYIKSLVVVPKVLYIYNTQDSFLTHKYRENLFQKRKLSIELLEAHLKTHNIDTNIIYYLYLKLLFAQVMQEQEHMISTRKRWFIIKNILNMEVIKTSIRDFKPKNLSERILWVIIKTKNPIVIDIISKCLRAGKKILSNKISRISV